MVSRKKLFVQEHDPLNFRLSKGSNLSYLDFMLTMSQNIAQGVAHKRVKMPPAKRRRGVMCLSQEEEDQGDGKAKRLLPKEVERSLIEKAKSGSRCAATKDANLLEISEEAREAFDTLFEAYRGAIKGFISSHLSPVQRNNDLEDLVQETALEAFKRVCTYDPETGKFYTWLLIWARYVLQRYFDEQRQRLDHEIVVSELVAQLRAQASEGEIDEETAEALIETLRVVPLTKLELSPETIAEILDKFRHFLRITFSEGGYPHQQIAFGFIRLLEWKPSEIVDELSEVPLQELAKRLEDDYVKILEYADKQKVRQCFQPLHERMKCKLKEVIPEGDDSWEIIRASPDDVVGKTRFPDYWGDRPTDNLSNWCYRVRQKTIREMVRLKLDC